MDAIDEEFDQLTVEVNEALVRYRERVRKRVSAKQLVLKEKLGELTKAVEVASVTPRRYAVLGNTRVGKTKFIYKLIYGEDEIVGHRYKQTIATEIRAFKRKDEKTGADVEDNIWEFCGNDSYLVPRPDALKNMHTIVIIKDPEGRGMREKKHYDKSPQQWSEYLLGTENDPRVKVISTYQEFEDALNRVD